MWFAEGFHSAFRKALDSTASVIVWNTIYLMDEDVWKDFCREMTEAEGTLRAKCLNSDVLNKGQAACNLMRTGLKMMKPTEFEAVEDFVKRCKQ